MIRTTRPDELVMELVITYLEKERESSHLPTSALESVKNSILFPPREEDMHASVLNPTAPRDLVPPMITLHEREQKSMWRDPGLKGLLR